jgi:hypothetical protein
MTRAPASWSSQPNTEGPKVKDAGLKSEKCGAARRFAGHPAPRKCVRVLVHRHAQAQLTRGFQSSNMPLGLCFHIHACSS